MLRSRSSSAALAHERPRLAPPLLVLALTLGVAATLVLLYPREDLVLRLASAPEGPLSAAYLRALLRTDPDNPRLRLLVANSLLRSGRPDEVHATLEPALKSPDPAIQRDALWLAWLAESQQLAQPAPAALRAGREARLKALGLSLIAVERDPARLAQVAGSLLALGEREPAMAVFAALEARTPGTLLQQLENAATLALARGDYLTAAEIHMAARRHATGTGARRAYFLAALRDLESGNRVADALRLAQRELGELADDRDVLLELVRLARAAREPEAAERYVRRLLRLSLLRQIERLALGQDYVLLRVARDAQPLPFDDAVYTLAYTVFVENRKLEDAYRVAASAVRQAPHDPDWRRRLAQVAEWTQRPEEALEQWLALARAGGGQEAWEAVRRLSLGLMRDDAYEAYLRQRLASRFDVALALELAGVQERQGRPEAARETLESAWRASRDTRLAQALAELSERLGELAQAIAWWQRAVADRPTPEQALRIATLHVLLDQTEAARAVLGRAAVDEATPAAFWRLKAQLATRSGDRSAARAALERLSLRPDAEVGDLNDLEWLLAEDEPLAAARVALARWRRFGDAEALIRALARFQDHARFDEAGTVLAGLDAQSRARLEQNPRYCLLAARQAWQQRDRSEAQRLYAQAQRLAPRDTTVAEARLWFAMESADTREVAALLARHGARLAAAGKTDALIAAHGTLGDIPAAWKLAAPELPRHRQDPLWLMLAADLLEQLDRADEAWQLRRHALRLLPPQGPRDIRFARARLAASLAPGDPELAALRAAVAADEPGDATSQLLLSHWINQGEYGLAQAWLYGRLVRHAANPRWAELAVALATDDRDRLAALLGEPQGLPRRDAVEAARRLDGALAASLAFDAQERFRSDDDLQEQLAPLLRGQGSHVRFVLDSLRFPALAETQRGVGIATSLTPRLKLSLELGSITRGLRDATALGTVLDEHRVNLRLAGGDEENGWQIGIGRRKALAATTPLSVRWQARRGRAGMLLEAGRALPAEESTALRLVGEQDSLSLTLSVEPVRPLTLAARLTQARYRAQTGTDLGRGRQLALHATTGLRAEDPDYLIDVFASRHVFAPTGGITDAALLPLLPPGVTAFDTNFFLPRDFTLWGMTLSSRTAFVDTPTRAWRPFWALTLSHHSEEGFGYDALMGAAGSLIGGDHAAGGLQWARAQGTTPGSTRRFFFRYRLDF